MTKREVNRDETNPSSTLSLWLSLLVSTNLCLLEPDRSREPPKLGKATVLSLAEKDPSGSSLLHLPSK